MTRKENEVNLDWLTEFVNLIPIIPAQRKNLLDIAGFPRWENVISNLLAFYLKKDEEHKFGTLFIKSLLEAYNSLSKDTDTTKLCENLYDESDYSVEREFTTKSGKRIDILLKCDTEWAIIIENKIDASLYNDLTDYWDFDVEINHKIGVVLSLNPMDTSKTNFVNITHQELIDKVNTNLHNYFLNADDRHLMFLKEYILNIESMYPNENNAQLDDFLKEYQKIWGKIANIEKSQKLKLKMPETQLNNIGKLQSFSKQLFVHVAQPVYDIMNKYGYSSGASKLDNSARFRIDENFMEKHDYGVDYNIINRLLFWVSFEHLRYHSEFLAFFELYGKNTEYGVKLDKSLLSEDIFRGCVSTGTDKNEKGGHYHIYKIQIPINFDNKSFEEALKEALDEHFFKKGFIEKAVNKLDAIIKEEKTKK
jgi:hypothetical protein